MNSLLTRLKDSIFSLSSGSQRLQAEDEDHELTEALRSRMLEAVVFERGDESLRMARRLRCANTLQSLWFMRSELVAFLSPRYGELEAMHRVEVISAPVRDALPSGLASCPAPLSRRSFHNGSLPTSRIGS